MTSATVDINGAADLMKIHPKSVLHLISSGIIPAARVGRSYVLLHKDVMIFIEDQVIRQTAERLGSPGRRIRGKALATTNARKTSRAA